MNKDTRTKGKDKVVSSTCNCWKKKKREGRERGGSSQEENSKL